MAKYSLVNYSISGCLVLLTHYIQWHWVKRPSKWPIAVLKASQSSQGNPNALKVGYLGSKSGGPNNKLVLSSCSLVSKTSL